MSEEARKNDGRLVLDAPFAEALPPGEPFETCMSLDGEIVRAAPGRRTFRFTLNGHAYYAKIHTGVGWGEVVKNLLSARLPVVSAANEWKALARVKELGIRAPEPVAFGERGRSPAARRSFIVTRSLEGTISLEDLAMLWKDDPPPLKRILINEVARIARTLHENGINHRDFYLCHFRLEEKALQSPAQFTGLILMDLHRAQIRRHVPCRWRIKDLAGLLFSSLDASVTSRDLLRFIRQYEGTSLRQALQARARLWRRVVQKAVRLYRNVHGRRPATKHLAIIGGER